MRQYSLCIIRRPLASNESMRNLNSKWQGNAHDGGDDKIARQIQGSSEVIRFGSK